MDKGSKVGHGKYAGPTMSVGRASTVGAIYYAR